MKTQDKPAICQMIGIQRVTPCALDLATALGGAFRPDPPPSIAQAQGRGVSPKSGSALPSMEACASFGLETGSFFPAQGGKLNSLATGLGGGAGPAPRWFLDAMAEKVGAIVREMLT